MRRIRRSFYLYLGSLSLIVAAIVIINLNSFAATTVTHTFIISPEKGGVVKNDSGTIGAYVNCPTDCTQVYAYSTTSPISYRAYPSKGYKFVGWESYPSIRAGYDYTVNPFTVNRAKDWIFAAVFELIPLPPPPTPTPPPPTPVPPTPPPPTPTPGPVYGGNKNQTPSTNNPASEDLVAVVEDKEPPTTPTDLTGEFSAKDNSINLSWSPSTDNSQMGGYEIEKIEKGLTNWQKIDSSEKERYSDFNFEAQKVYQYRVRAFDQLKNYSDFSNIIEITAEKFIPNVTVKEGGLISDIDNKITLDFPAGTVSEDLFILIEKTDNRGFETIGNAKIVGEVFEIKAKNIHGEEVTRFNAQIPLKLKYTSEETKGLNSATIKIATVKDGKIDFLRTKLNSKNMEATTITDHLSLYMLVAEKSSSLLIFLRILLWIFMIIGIGFAGYFGWTHYQKRKYKQEHRDDYIYKH